MKKKMKYTSILVFLYFIFSPTTYSLDPSYDVSCCRSIRDNKEIQKQCNHLNLNDCDTILENRSKTEQKRLEKIEKKNYKNQEKEKIFSYVILWTLVLLGSYTVIKK